jgi:hypothetical protein
MDSNEPKVIDLSKALSNVEGRKWPTKISLKQRIFGFGKNEELKTQFDRTNEKLDFELDIGSIIR